MRPPGVGAARVTARVGERRELRRAWRSRNQPSQTLSPLPPSPTRFMPSFQSPVPISGRPCSPTVRLLVERARAMLEQRARSFGRPSGWKNASCSPAAERGPSRNGTCSSRTAVVAGDRRYSAATRRPARRGRRRCACARPARWRQPPMLDVAFDELPGGRAQQMARAQSGRGEGRAP